ncbi:RDD family protein [Pseudarthrobacter sp. J1738]|uniref:RDD family protein n=1 Tax=Pseudarthrobacter sp. J1738 TaxID=3420446 RepID=UPI003D2B04B0
MTAIITGEAVVLELRPASFLLRAVGLIIDVVLTLVLYFVALTVVGSAAESTDLSTGVMMSLVLLIFFTVIVPVTVETLTRGRSLGKMIVGIRVVRDDGGAIRVRHAVIRGLAGFLEIYMTLGSVALLAGMFNERAKRLGDLMAGTHALKDRVTEEVKVVPEVPPRLRGWATMADIGRLPDAVSRRTLAYMQQAARMTPEARWRVSTELVAEVSRYVAPSAPQGTGPDEFLSAVMAERRSRDLARLTKSAARSAKLAQRIERLPYAD